ncbi:MULTISPECIES: hypothetical protein [Streptomyces]|uniref:hypothetical protein n=1 Tax=Streptomyces TaxID=1883 RepID=UPI00240E7043|nr:MULTISPECIES: hypothetical protein [Streptomyces]WFB88498.1 hypothetical protein MMU79_37290 [Streptomyces olivaceus]WGK50940.1 hypothetical protein M6G09_38030 [Streptomyces sp. B146]
MSLFPNTSGHRGRTARRGPSGEHPADEVRLEGGDGVYVVLRDKQPPPWPAGTEETLRAAAPGAVTVLLTTALDGHEVDRTASLLAPVVNGARAAGEPLRLAMSGAANAGSGAEPPARRLSEHLAIDIVAPSGPAVVVPGGTLFTPDTSSADDGGEPPGWWCFSPGEPARYLGLRLPAPAWEAALTRLRPDLADRHILQPVPAGLLLRPANAPADAGGLAHAVPPDPHGPILVVGVPSGRPVDAEAVETVVAALPRRVRDSLLMVPGDGRDLVPTAREAAEALGTPLRAGNGLPVFLDGAAPADVPSTILVDSHGEPSWQPYVTSVLCDPGDGPDAGARALSWRLPDGWEEPDPTKPGVLTLGRWQATATRAGLWVGKPQWQAEAPVVRAPESDVVALELGVGGRALDDSLWPELERLFSVLDEDVRDRAIVRVHGNVGAGGMRTLRRLTVRHGLALAARGPRAVYPADVSKVAGLSPSAAPSAAPPDPEAPARSASAPARTSAPEETDAAEAPEAASALASVPPPSPVRVVTSSGDGPAGHASAAGQDEGTGLLAAAATPSGLGTASSPAVRPGEPASDGAGGPEAALGSGTDDAQDGQPESGGLTDVLAEAPSQEGAEWPPSGALEAPWPEWPPRTAENALFSRTPPAENRTDGSPPASFGVEEGGAEPTGISGPAPAAKTPAQPHHPASDADGAILIVDDVPVTPAHRSEAADRRAIKSLLAADWEALAAMVQRALTSLPGLRTSHDQEGLRADLITVSSYLLASGGALEDDALRAGLRRRDDAVRSLLGCIASGLSHLPCHRGVALRTAGLLSEDHALLPGEEVGDALPVRALAAGAAYGNVAEDHYLLWSTTGRRTDALVPGENGPGHVLFAPGTRFRVLGTGLRSGAKSLFLRELAPHEDVGVPGRLTDVDRRILDRLTAVAEAPPAKSDEAVGAPRGVLGVFAENAFTATPL